MPTIAEIIAAKKAKESSVLGSRTPVAKNSPTGSIAERLEVKAAIDAIDPPGKPAAAANARKMAGLILNKDMPCAPESRGQSTPITGPPEEPEPRSLSMTDGEAIPLVPTTANQQEEAWHAALNAFESELCLMQDPKDPERAWIAVRLDGQEQWPILLKSFPFYQHPRTERPDNEPF